MEEPPEGAGAPPVPHPAPALPITSSSPAPALLDAPPVAPIPAFLAAELVSATQQKQNAPPEASFDAKYEAQRIYINRLQALTEKQRLEIQRLKEQQLKVTTEWQKKVQQLTQHNEIFQEQTASLEVRVAELEAQLREVRAELNRVTAAAQQCEARGDGLQAALSQADANQSRFLNFQRNVLVMENQLLSDRAQAARVPELEQQLKARDEEIELLRIQQQQHLDAQSGAEARVAGYVQRIVMLEKERDERRAESARHKRFVEYQKDVSGAKAEESEKKYKLLKDVNFALEREILRLHTEIYKNQHFPTGENYP